MKTLHSALTGYSAFQCRVVLLWWKVWEFVEFRGSKGLIVDCVGEGAWAFTEAWTQRSRAYFLQAAFTSTGVLNESFVKGMRDPRWLWKPEKWAKRWQDDKGLSVQESVDAALLENIGTPIHNMLSYLEFNHSLHCVPSNVSSGLATLPLPEIYWNGTSTGEKTTGVLPTGEKLSGKRAYEMILPYFTTNDMTPDEVYDLGQTMLNKLYPEAVQIAMNYTRESNSTRAVEKFKSELAAQKMFFNDMKIPENESNKEAFSKCTSLETAKVHCPMRYKAMMAWFKEVNGACVVWLVAVFSYHVTHLSFPPLPFIIRSSYHANDARYCRRLFICGPIQHWTIRFAAIVFTLSYLVCCSFVSKEILSVLAPKTTHMFHFTSDKQTTPNCPVKLVANFNPGTGSQSYSASGKSCPRAGHYRLPFYLKDLGPRYNAISVAAHEARPGHHTQVGVANLTLGQTRFAPIRRRRFVRPRNRKATAGQIARLVSWHVILEHWGGNGDELLTNPADFSSIGNLFSIQLDFQHLPWYFSIMFVLKTRQYSTIPLRGFVHGRQLTVYTRGNWSLFQTLERPGSRKASHICAGLIRPQLLSYSH